MSTTKTVKIRNIYLTTSCGVSGIKKVKIN